MVGWNALKSMIQGNGTGPQGGAAHSADLWPVSSASSKPFGYFNYPWFLRYTEEPPREGEEERQTDRQKQYGGEGKGGELLKETQTTKGTIFLKTPTNAKPARWLSGA